MKMRLQPAKSMCLCLITLTLLLAGCAGGEDARERAAGEQPGNAQESSVIAPMPEQVPAEATSAIALPDLGPAPAWSNETWINSEQPLLLPDLRGKVVLLEFWTFG